MDNWFFFVPYGYFVKTRVTTLAAQMSWVLIYFVPLFLTVFAFQGEIEILDVLYLLLGTTAIYALYEIGYIDNDTTTVQLEAEPTRRLDQNQTAYVQAQLFWIYGARIALAIVAFILCFAAPGFAWGLIGIFVLVPTFFFYNRTRSALNALLHPVLVSVRFCAPVLLLIPDLEVLLYLLLLFPLLNSLERAAEPRYGFVALQNFILSNQTSGRWLYYLIVMLLVSVYLPIRGESPALLIPMAYMFSYRLVTSYLRPHKAGQ